MCKLPEARGCLFAEQVRPEIGGKSTILGFFGISPDVIVTVSEIPAVINFAAILLFAKSTEKGKIDVELSLDGPAGAIVAKTMNSVMEAEIGKPMTCAFNFQGIPIHEAGTYMVTITSEDAMHSSHTFSIQQSRNT